MVQVKKTKNITTPRTIERILDLLAFLSTKIRNYSQANITYICIHTF